MVSANRRCWVMLLLPGALACTPAFSDRASEIDGPRVLAVQSQPAEAAPGSSLTYGLLVVDQSGTVSAPDATWSYCTQVKPTNELDDVAAACFGEGDFVMPFGTGAAPSATLPITACRQFGPDLPHTEPGQPQGRPTDADSTGGYYQPVILQVSTQGATIPTLGETRITCGLAGSTGEQLEDYQNRTKPNQNPSLLGVSLPNQAGAALSADDATQATVLAAGQDFVLRASWPACPSEPSCGDGICSPGEAIQDCPADCTTPVGCGGSEPYAYLDPEQHVLVSRHESMRVSWFASAGSFESDHTGTTEDEFTQTTSDDTWTAPNEAGPAFLWVVLRDDRGGVAWQSYRAEVQ